MSSRTYTRVNYRTWVIRSAIGRDRKPELARNSKPRTCLGRKVSGVAAISHFSTTFSFSGKVPPEPDPHFRAFSRQQKTAASALRIGHVASNWFSRGPRSEIPDKVSGRMLAWQLSLRRFLRCLFLSFSENRTEISPLPLERKRGER